MGKIAIGYGNLTDSSTLSGGSWFTPLNEIQSRELARYAQSMSSSSSHTQIIFDHGSAKAAQVFAIFAHNIADNTATIQVTRGTTSGASDVYDSGVVSCWPFTPLGSDYDGSHFGIFVVAGSASTARYTKIAVVNSLFIRIGRTFVGPMFTPNYNPEYGSYADDWQNANSIVGRTENGADWAATRTELRATAFSYPAISHTQGSLVHEIVRTHSVTGEVVFVANTEDRARQQQYGFLGTMRKLSALEYPFWDHRSVAIGIDERGGAP
jgi:hypothetical protein